MRKLSLMLDAKATLRTNATRTSWIVRR